MGRRFLPWAGRRRRCLGKGIYLTFGAFEEGEKHESKSLEVAETVCRVLSEHGIEFTWDGTYAQRIRLSPFDWRKRRHTAAPN